MGGTPLQPAVLRLARPFLTAAMLAAGVPVPEAAQAQQPARTVEERDVAGRMRRADDAYASGNTVRAEQEYAAIVALDPAQSRAVFRLAQLRQPRDLPAAVTLYRRYVGLEPRDAWGHMALGNALAARGDATGALKAYDAAARLEPSERDVHVGRARVLSRVGRTDASVVAYGQWLAMSPRDAEAWRELAVQQRRAGRPHAAITSLERAGSLATDNGIRRQIEREIIRNRTSVRAALEPVAGGSRDSDGLSTTRAGFIVSSPLVGTTRINGMATFRRAGDGTHARSSQDLLAGAQFRPLAQLRMEIAGGISRAERASIDTLITDPRVGGPVRGPRPPAGPGSPADAGASQAYAVGRARIVWRAPGEAVAVDARAGRQLLDASPFLVAQGVLRDEAAATVDLRLRGPVRVRAFGRTAAIHNVDERNTRRLVGGAFAYVPGPYEVTVRAQQLSYAGPTTLAYFAPRYVNAAELTAYLEREASHGATVTLDLGAGAQQVADWDAQPAAWSPALRGWAQFVIPLGTSLSAGTELEAYDASFGAEGRSIAPTAARWRYGAASVFMRVAF